MAHAPHVGVNAPGLAAPERPPDVVAPQAGGLGEGRDANQDNGRLDSATSKHDATLVALFALAGFELRRIDADSWLVCRWDLSRELSQAELAGFAQQVGVRL